MLVFVVFGFEGSAAVISFVCGGDP